MDAPSNVEVPRNDADGDSGGVAGDGARLLDDLYQDADDLADVALAASHPNRWILNIGGEGEFEAPPGSRVVNVNDGSWHMGTRTPDQVLNAIETGGQLLVIARAEQLPFRDESAGVVARHLPLAGGAKDDALDEALRVRERGGRFDLHFCHLAQRNDDGDSLLATVH